MFDRRRVREWRPNLAVATSVNVEGVTDYIVQGLAAAGAADKAIVDLQKQFDQGFLTKLPESVTPTVTYCLYDFSQFDQPPAWDDNGYQLIAGTACTITYRPTMNPADKFSTAEDGVIQNYSPTYFEDFYYSEVMVDNLVFPYWQQGLLGSVERKPWGLPVW